MLKMISSQTNTLPVQIQISLLNVRSAANENGQREVVSVLCVGEDAGKPCGGLRNCCADRQQGDKKKKKRKER